MRFVIIVFLVVQFSFPKTLYADPDKVVFDLSLECLKASMIIVSELNSYDRNRDTFLSRVHYSPKRNKCYALVSKSMGRATTLEFYDVLEHNRLGFYDSNARGSICMTQSLECKGHGDFDKFVKTLIED